MIIQENDLYKAWLLLLDELLRAPVAAPRGLPCRERLGLQLRVRRGLANVVADPQRKLNYRFLVGQWLATLAGVEEKVLAPYNKYISRYEDDGHGGKYPSYGPRLRPQWPYVLKALADDPDTRQAVASIWEAQTSTCCPECGGGGKVYHRDEGSPPEETCPRCQGHGKFEINVPCTLSLQFLLRPDPLQRRPVLHTVVSMRSSDAWLGIPYDVFNFSMLANVLAASYAAIRRTRVEVGELVLNLGSSHLYEPHWETARSIVAAPAGTCLTSPLFPPGLDQPLALLEQLLTRQPAPLAEKDWGWLPWPWRTYVAALEKPTNAEALVVLTGADRREGGKFFDPVIA